jgi:hypothetical protein
MVRSCGFEAACFGSEKVLDFKNVPSASNLVSIVGQVKGRKFTYKSVGLTYCDLNAADLKASGQENCLRASQTTPRTSRANNCQGRFGKKLDRFAEFKGMVSGSAGI